MTEYLIHVLLIYLMKGDLGGAEDENKSSVELKLLKKHHLK